MSRMPLSSPATEKRGLDDGSHTSWSRMNKETIELRHLRYFAAFCESGGTSEAAKRLGVAPTTVKRSIRELELLLNVKLLVRGSRTLTDSGKLMRTHANNVLKYLAVAMEALRSGNEAQPKGIV